MYDSLHDVKSNRPVIFVGPSLHPNLVRNRIPNAIIRPPIRRNDLYGAREAGYQEFLILDGEFGQTFAVSPREIVDVLRDGAQVIGASSMGALRAADCYPAGMVGVGLIYRGFRMGFLTSDDEVAVITGIEPPFEALSIPLVNIRFNLNRAVRHGHITQSSAEEIMEGTRAVHFSRRILTALLRLYPDLQRCCPLIDFKRLDAERGVDYVKKDYEILASKHSSNIGVPIRRPVRYSSHDRFIGRDPRDVKVALTRWLWSTGRYQRYLWPLLIGRPEVPDAAASDMTIRPMALRESASKAMHQMLSNLPALADLVFSELEFLEEADAEIVRWYAVQQMYEHACIVGAVPSAPTMKQVQTEVAVLHGFRQWNSLINRVENRLLWDAIPFEWIEEACLRWATARTYSDMLVRPL
jgi:hypothetical protein